MLATKVTEKVLKIQSFESVKVFIRIPMWSVAPNLDLIDLFGKIFLHIEDQV